MSVELKPGDVVTIDGRTITLLLDEATRCAAEACDYSSDEEVTQLADAVLALTGAIRLLDARLRKAGL